MDAPPHQRGGPATVGNLACVFCFVQDLPKRLAPNGNLFHSVLHLVDEVLYLIDIAGKLFPPRTQQILLVEHRQCSAGHSRDQTRAALTGKQQHTACDEGTTSCELDPLDAVGLWSGHIHRGFTFFPGNLCKAHGLFYPLEARSPELFRRCFTYYSD